MALLQNGQAAAQQTCTSRASLCPEGAVWREGTDFVRWDGTQLTRYPIPAGAEETGDCVLLKSELTDCPPAGGLRTAPAISGSMRAPPRTAVLL